MSVATMQERVPVYRVCRKMMAPPRVHVTPQEPVDCAYVPLSLQALCCRVLRKASVEPASLGAMSSVYEEMGEMPAWYERKDRTCESIRDQLVVGGFAAYPQATREAAPEMFSVDLHGGAQRVLELLRAANDLSCLDDVSFLRQVTLPRYEHFLRVQAEHMEQPLRPPLDVAQMWLTHMLQSKEYHEYAAQVAPGLEWLPHALWSECDEEASVRLFEASGSHKYPVPAPASKRAPPVSSDVPVCGHEVSNIANLGLPYTKRDFSYRRRLEPAMVIAGSQEHLDDLKNAVHVSGIEGSLELPNAVVADRTWLRQLNPRFAADTALLGYQRYLFLLAKYPQKMEYIAFGPAPCVDLYWHTHLLAPRAYWADMRKLIFGVPHHKLLPEEARTEFVFTEKSSKEDVLWQEEFGEQLAVYF